MDITPSLSELLEMNRRHSRQFLAEQPMRQKFLQQCPVQIGGLSCMDGRTKLSNLTALPFGCIRRDWRVLGGIAEVGVPRFRTSVDNWRRYAEERNQEALLLVTHHFSASNNQELGCRGHQHNKAAAEAAAIDIQQQLRRVYEMMPYVVVFGIETDFDTFYVRNERGEIAASDTFADSDDIDRWVRDGFPEMTPSVCRALTSVIAGNAQHVRSIRAMNRPIELACHQEFAVVVGDGCWTEHNAALVVGPYSYDLGHQIQMAGGLLWDNFLQQRTNGHQPVLLSCAVAGKKDPPHVRRGADEEARSLMLYAEKMLREHTPELSECLVCRAGVLDLDTRLITLI